MTPGGQARGHRRDRLRPHRRRGVGTSSARASVRRTSSSQHPGQCDSELANRSTAQISAVLGSSVVLVCRPSTPRRKGFYDDVVRALEARIAERLDAFEEMGLVGADYFVSAIGPAFEVFAQYSRIVKLSGEEVDVAELMVLARQAVARHAMRRLLGAGFARRARRRVALLLDVALGVPHCVDSGRRGVQAGEGVRRRSRASRPGRAGSPASRARTSRCSARRSARG